MRICSFDIGIKNFSVCIEDYDVDLKEDLPNQLSPPKIKYKKSTLEATDELKVFIREVAKLGKIVHLERKELGERKHYFSGAAYHNLYNWVDELHPYLETTDIILIEQQMRVNNVALSLMSHLQAYLLIKYCRYQYFEHQASNQVSNQSTKEKSEDKVTNKKSKKKKGETNKESEAIEAIEALEALEVSEVSKPKRGRKKKEDISIQIQSSEQVQSIEPTIQINPYIKYCCIVKLYPSKNKTRVLGAALKEEDSDGKLKKVSKYNRKKWSVNEVDKILKDRQDEKWHTYIFKENKSKKDDLSDVIVQSLSYIISKYL